MLNSERGEATVARILHAAAPMIARHGSRGISLKAIADAAGLSKTGLLHHFTTKEALLAAVLDWRDELDGYPNVFGGQVGRAGFEFIIDYVTSWRTRPESVGLFTVLLVENLAEGAFHQRLLTRARVVRDGVANVVSEGQRQGDFRTEADPFLIAGEFIAFINGLETYWLLDREIDPVSLAKNWLDRLYSEILTDKAKRNWSSP